MKKLGWVRCEACGDAELSIRMQDGLCEKCTTELLCGDCSPDQIRAMPVSTNLATSSD